jgi:hypothetical protein
VLVVTDKHHPVWKNLFKFIAHVDDTVAICSSEAGLQRDNRGRWTDLRMIVKTLDLFDCSIKIPDNDRDVFLILTSNHPRSIFYSALHLTLLAMKECYPYYLNTTMPRRTDSTKLMMVPTTTTTSNNTTSPTATTTTESNNNTTSSTNELSSSSPIPPSSPSANNKNNNNATTNTSPANIQTSSPSPKLPSTPTHSNSATNLAALSPVSADPQQDPDTPDEPTRSLDPEAIKYIESLLFKSVQRLRYLMGELMSNSQTEENLKLTVYMLYFLLNTLKKSLRYADGCHRVLVPFIKELLRKNLVAIEQCAGQSLELGDTILLEVRDGQKLKERENRKEMGVYFLFLMFYFHCSKLLLMILFNIGRRNLISSSTLFTTSRKWLNKCIRNITPTSKPSHAMRNS